MSFLLHFATVAVTAFTHTASRVAPADSFDVYFAGAHFAELTVVDNGGSRSYTVRKKDLASNQWRPAVTASESQVARDTAFALWGSIKSVAASMPSLRTIHWSLAARRRVARRQHDLRSAHRPARGRKPPHRLGHPLGGARCL